jgi:hypothetical protein
VIIGGVRHFKRSDLDAWSKLNVGEAARLAQCHPATVAAAAASGELPSVDLAGSPRFDRADVLRWAQALGVLVLP